MEYFYTRELQADSRYNIGYVGEKISLAEEIQDTFPSHSVKVMCNGTTVKVEISPTLSAGEKTTLDTIVSDHKNNIDPAPTAFKVNEEYIIDPNVNVNHFSLHRQDIIDSNGWLIEKNYYKNFDGVNYTDLAIKDEYDYYLKSGTDLVDYRIETITWYLEDNNIGHQKSFTKYYTLEKAIREGITRRNNLLEKAKAYGLANITGNHEVSGEPVIPNSYYFFNSIISEVEVYIAGTNKDALISVIEDSEESFLTQQIKDDLVDILKYWT